MRQDLSSGSKLPSYPFVYQQRHGKPNGCHTAWLAAWLVQFIERQTYMRECRGFEPRLDQHSGS